MTDIFDVVKGVLDEMNIKYQDGELRSIDPSPAKTMGDSKLEKILERVFMVPTLKKSRFGGLFQKDDPRGTICAINAEIYEKKRLTPFYVGIRGDLDNGYVSTFVDFSGDDNLSKWATIKAEAKNYKL